MCIFFLQFALFSVILRFTHSFQKKVRIQLDSISPPVGFSLRLSITFIPKTWPLQGPGYWYSRENTEHRIGRRAACTGVWWRFQTLGHVLSLNLVPNFLGRAKTHCEQTLCLFIVFFFSLEQGPVFSKSMKDTVECSAAVKNTTTWKVFLQIYVGLISDILCMSIRTYIWMDLHRFF